MDLKELLRKRAKLVADAREITAKATAEARSLTPEERTSFDALANQAETVGADIATRERLIALESTVGADGVRTGDPLPHEISTRHQYSVLKAIRQAMNFQKIDGLEGEVSAELVKRRKKDVRGNGFLMPLNLGGLSESRQGSAIERRSGVMNTTTGAGGIATILDTTYVDMLRNRMVVKQAGARILTDMVGAFSIPRQNGAATGYWVGESGAVTASNQTIDQVPFSPRSVGGMTDISRRFAEMVSIDAEMFVREDLAAVVARSVDLAALNGTGNANQPLGILQNPAITVEAIGTNGGAPTWDMLVNLETDVAIANADIGTLAYVTNAKLRGKLKRTAKIGSTYPEYLWDTVTPDRPLNGYPSHVTNQLPSNLTKGSSGAVCSPIIFGNWNDLVLAFWSGLDVIVDPFTGSSSGTVRIVTLQDVDINVRHPESFANCVDNTTS